MPARIAMHCMRKKSQEGLETVIVGATLAKANYVRRAVICGQSLNEQMCSIAIRDHGMESIHPREARQMFSKWLSRHAPKIPRDKAYQWMATAAHVMRLLLEMRGSGPNGNPDLDYRRRKGLFHQRHFGDAGSRMLTEARRMFKDTFNTFLWPIRIQSGTPSDWSGRNQTRAFLLPKSIQNPKPTSPRIRQRDRCDGLGRPPGRRHHALPYEVPAYHPKHGKGSSGASYPQEHNPRT